MSKRPIVHVEIPAADRLAAAKFYADMFGWEFQDIPEIRYTTFMTDSVGGGFMDLSEHFKPGDVLIYIASDDIEADLKRVEELGGKMVVSKQEIPDIGWFGVFTDPTGNLIALFTDKVSRERGGMA